MPNAGSSLTSDCGDLSYLLVAHCRATAAGRCRCSHCLRPLRCLCCRFRRRCSGSCCCDVVGGCLERSRIHRCRRIARPRWQCMVAACPHSVEAGRKQKSAGVFHAQTVLGWCCGRSSGRGRGDRRPAPVGAGSNKWMFGVSVEGAASRSSGWWSQGGMPRFVVIQALLVGKRGESRGCTGRLTLGKVFCGGGGGWLVSGGWWVVV